MLANRSARLGNVANAWNARRKLVVLPIRWSWALDSHVGRLVGMSVRTGHRPHPGVAADWYPPRPCAARPHRETKSTNRPGGRAAGDTYATERPPSRSLTAVEGAPGVFRRLDRRRSSELPASRAHDAHRPAGRRVETARDYGQRTLPGPDFVDRWLVRDPPDSPWNRQVVSRQGASDWGAGRRPDASLGNTHRPCIGPSSMNRPPCLTLSRDSLRPCESGCGWHPYRSGLWSAPRGKHPLSVTTASAPPNRSSCARACASSSGKSAVLASSVGSARHAPEPLPLAALSRSRLPPYRRPAS